MASLADKNLDRWIGGYFKHLVRRALVRRAPRPRHLLFALCDHYEPLWGRADVRRGERRLLRRLNEYQRGFDGFRDADGRMPQHSWFFPAEQYRAVFLDGLAELAAQGCGEVELHLHHDRDTEGGLRAKILEGLALFAEHGHLCREWNGRVRYGFIHGNWALANGRPDGRWCGVDGELPILFETGCFADFTFPSCPDPTQPRTVNALYWPSGELSRRRAYDGGELARTFRHHDDRILMVTGPLGFALRPGSLRPRLEYGALTAHDPASSARVRSWVAQGIHVWGQPQWIFVKVHTHGAPEAEAESLLGSGGFGLHRALTQTFNDGIRWKLHYVAAREMFNIARAAMDGKRGDPCAYRDHVLAPPPVRGV